MDNRKVRRMESSPTSLFSYTLKAIRTPSTIGTIEKAKYYGNGRGTLSNQAGNKK
jgi:hypothetical protein